MGAGEDVVDEAGAGFRAVRHPQLLAMASIPGREVDETVDRRELTRVRAVLKGQEVPQQQGAAAGAVRDPELVPELFGREGEHGAEADRCDLRGRPGERPQPFSQFLDASRYRIDGPELHRLVVPTGQKQQAAPGRDDRQRTAAVGGGAGDAESFCRSRRRRKLPDLLTTSWQT